MNHNFKEGQLVVAIADCPNGHYKKGHTGKVFVVGLRPDYESPVNYDHLLIQWDHNYETIGVHYKDIALKKEVSSTPEIESKLTQLREDMGNVGIPYKAGKYIIALEDEINRLRIEVAELKSTIREHQRNN